MSVYVDPLMKWPKSPNWSFGAVSHMYADTEEELHEFAKKLGLRREWHSEHTHKNPLGLSHYDLTPKKRQQAVDMGAEEVSYGHGELYRLRTANSFLMKRCRSQVLTIREKDELIARLRRRICKLKQEG